MMVFDAYEVRARLAPALVVASPWMLVVAALLQASASTLLSTSAAAVVFIALIYAFSFAVSHLGRRIEDGLWNSWGGPPSATVLSKADATFSAETKSRIRSSLVATLGIRGTTLPGWAAETDRVQETFRLVRQLIRQRDPKGLWSTHNAEYGFLRNLLGSWWLLLLNSLLAAGVCGVLWHMRGGETIFILGALSLGLALTAILGRIFILPSAIRSASVRYAESAWTSFLANAQRTDHNNQGEST